MGHQKEPDFVKVKSSMISEIAYDKAAAVLHVKFPNGTHYAYFEVAPSLYHEMKKAPSIGGFFAQNVRGRFQHRMVPAEQIGAAK